MTYCAADECGWGSLARQCPVGRQEYRVAQLTAAGLTVKHIALTLGIAAGSIKVYRSRLYDKLGVPNDVALGIAFSRGELCVVASQAEHMEAETFIRHRIDAAIVVKSEIDSGMRRAAEIRFKSKIRAPRKHDYTFRPSDKDRVARLLGANADTEYYSGVRVRTESPLASI